MTFSNKGEINYIKVAEVKKDIKVKVNKTMTIQQSEDEEMYDSDEEDEQYLKSLKTYGYYAICANKDYIAYCKYEKAQIEWFDLNTQESFKPVSLGTKDIYITMSKMLSGNRLLVCYDSNKFLIHDMDSKTLSKYSKQNLKSFPVNFLNNYNRIYGVVELSDTKLLLYTHFSYILVDLEAKIPEYSKLIKNHPSKTDTRVMSWNENLAHHHKKYMDLVTNTAQGKSTDPAETPGDAITDNFKIDNKFKGILYMEQLQDGTMVVVENLWKNLVNKLPEVLKVHKFGH